MAASDKIIHLRQLLAERFPQLGAPAAERLPTGVPAIDEALGGGLPKSAITELSSPNFSAGSALFTHALLQNAHRGAFFLALVDGRDSFDPQTAGPNVLANLFWVRCAAAAEAVKAADLLLRDGNFPLVVLDLVLNPAEELRKIPQSNWYRLQRLVEGTPTAFLVLTRQGIISSAQLKLSLANAWHLSDLERTNTASRLKIEVNRVHGGREFMARAG
jgi:hypothetical protein